MQRLTRIEVDSAHRLLPGDECFHFGEYQARGGYEACDTNQRILNLKIGVPVPEHRARWKRKAILECGDMVASAIDHDHLRSTVTLVPAPGSKPVGHPNYDDRMVQVCERVRSLVGLEVDVRQVLRAGAAREAQHLSDSRLRVEDLVQSLVVDTAAIAAPLRPTVIVVDDVFTLGTTFRAMKSLLVGVPGVAVVAGVFIARTVWPVDLSVFDGI